MALKETLLELMHNASHSIVLTICRFFRATPHFEACHETTAALRKEADAWENSSAEALENFEKRFG
jgi:hypothetical protein